MTTQPYERPMGEINSYVRGQVIAAGDLKTTGCRTPTRSVVLGIGNQIDAITVSLRGSIAESVRMSDGLAAEGSLELKTSGLCLTALWARFVGHAAARYVRERHRTNRHTMQNGSSALYVAR